MISIIMLTYNREKFISRAIESILVQTYRDFEFIIVDNGSSDLSGVVADDYAQKDKRITVIHKKRGNIGSGRNVGLDHAKGDYIAFIDDDDYAEKDFLEFLYNLIVENDADVSICGAFDKAFCEKKIMTAEESLIELMWRKKYNMAFPTKMFKKKIIENLRFSEDAEFDDIELMYQLLGNSKKIAYYGLPKYTFYRHENNNSAWTTNYNLLTSKILSEYLLVYRMRTDWLINKFPNSAETFQYFEWSFMISMVEKIKRLNIRGCEKELEYMLGVLQKNKRKFINDKNTIDFEKVWIEKYVK